MNSEKQVIYCPEDDENRINCDIVINWINYVFNNFFKNPLKSQTH